MESLIVNLAFYREICKSLSIIIFYAASVLFRQDPVDGDDGDEEGLKVPKYN